MEHITFSSTGKRLITILFLVSAGAIAACSGDPKPAVTTTPGPSEKPTNFATPVATASPSGTAAAMASGGGRTVTATAPAKKVNVSTATRAETQTTLTAAGVPNAAQWTREVEEYRPYPSDDPTWAKLRKELAKYNPAAGVVDQIIATLMP